MNSILELPEMVFREIIEFNSDKDESDLIEMSRDEISAEMAYLNDISIYAFAEGYFNRDISVERVHPSTSRLMLHYFMSTQRRREQIVEYNSLMIHYIMFDYHELYPFMAQLLQDDCRLLKSRTIEIYLNPFLCYENLHQHLANLLLLIAHNCAVYVNLPEQDSDNNYYLTDNEKYMNIIKTTMAKTREDRALRTMLLTISYETNLVRMNERILAIS